MPHLWRKKLNKRRGAYSSKYGTYIHVDARWFGDLVVQGTLKTKTNGKELTDALLCLYLVFLQEKISVHVSQKVNYQQIAQMNGAFLLQKERYKRTTLAWPRFKTRDLKITEQKVLPL